MSDQIVHTHLRVAGVRTQADVTNALQALYDVFTEVGVGGATFEVTDADAADLFIKHKDSVTPDVATINEALSRAGSFRVVD